MKVLCLKLSKGFEGNFSQNMEHLYRTVKFRASWMQNMSANCSITIMLVDCEYLYIYIFIYCCEVKGGRCDLFEGTTLAVPGKHENPQSG
jgi:hypothetical protein